MDNKNTPDETNGPFCPELPTRVSVNKLSGQPDGWILTPCIGEKCAKFLGCQVVPKLAEKYFKQGIITGPVS